jgi:thiosulfate/3-mercaptopyruvate sulfurtransferase
MQACAEFSPLISVAQLQSALAQADGSWIILEASFDLADESAGQAIYQQSHLPGALYAHLTQHMSGTKYDSAGQFRGRHPLPERAVWAQQVGQWGIIADSTVVVYDRQGGMYAARLWWLMRWLGHSRVAVLDGGFQAWQQAHAPLDTTVQMPWSVMGTYLSERPSLVKTIGADQLQNSLLEQRVIDARAPERYRGEVEPLDAVAGHIPGAVNRFFKLNLTPQGLFKSPEALRHEFLALASEAQWRETVHQCGSGVTACHNLLALEVAGLGGGVLYPGSWSEWCASQPPRPMTRGAQL